MIHPQALIKLFGYSAELIEKQTVGLTHGDSLRQVLAEANSINWVLGHVISARTVALRLVDEEPVWTDEQRARYRHTSANVLADDKNVVRLEELVVAFCESQRRLVRGLSRMSYEAMCQPSGYEENTVGDSLAYFHFHEAQHVGQLLYLAQAIGKEGAWLG